jgi:hypothetical protein
VWLVLPIYDAVLIECSADQIDDVIARAVPIMQHAVRAYYPALRPRVEVNRSHPECWNKDGHADSLERFLADPTFSLDRLDSDHPAFPWETVAKAMEYAESERAQFIARLESAGANVGPAAVDELFERYQERAAIREFEGGFPRDEAEKLALKDVLGEARAAS